LPTKHVNLALESQINFIAQHIFNRLRTCCYCGQHYRLRHRCQGYQLNDHGLYTTTPFPRISYGGRKRAQDAEAHAYSEIQEFKTKLNSTSWEASFRIENRNTLESQNQAVAITSPTYTTYRHSHNATIIMSLRHVSTLNIIANVRSCVIVYSTLKLVTLLHGSSCALLLLSP